DPMPCCPQRPSRARLRSSRSRTRRRSTSRSGSAIRISNWCRCDAACGSDLRQRQAAATVGSKEDPRHMTDSIRVNGNSHSWGSIVVKIAGVKYYGFDEISYGDKRERVKGYGLGE